MLISLQIWAVFQKPNHGTYQKVAGRNVQIGQLAQHLNLISIDSDLLPRLSQGSLNDIFIVYLHLPSGKGNLPTVKTGIFGSFDQREMNVAAVRIKQDQHTASAEVCRKFGRKSPVVDWMGRHYQMRFFSRKRRWQAIFQQINQVAKIHRRLGPLTSASYPSRIPAGIRQPPVSV